MPIIVPGGLPAIKALGAENITVITEARAIGQDIRPLKIVVLNLMPTKIATENQLIRLLSNTPLQVEAILLQTKTYVAKNTAPKHMQTFYKTFDEIKNECFDGLIITGAPVENLAFEGVDYWAELCDIMAWSKTHVFSVMHICWGAQAGLHFHYGIPKHRLKKKLSGVYLHESLQPNNPILRGFDEEFYAPHSRCTENRICDIAEKADGLEILSVSRDAGVYMVATPDLRQIYVTGHPEYDASTLAQEYERDIRLGLNPDVPVNYFTGDNPKLPPKNRWRGHGYLLFSNWLNYVYQEVPYDLEAIKNA